MTELLEQRMRARDERTGKRKTFIIEPTAGDVRRSKISLDPAMRDDAARLAAKNQPFVCGQKQWSDIANAGRARYCPSCGQEVPPGVEIIDHDWEY
jgi:hypothetical protein